MQRKERRRRKNRATLKQNQGLSHTETRSLGVSKESEWSNGNDQI